MNRQSRRAAASQTRAAPHPAAAHAATHAAIPSLFAQAVREHQAGRYAEAEAIYRRILAIDPTHPESRHHLGLLALQLGRADAAVDMIRAAIVARPDNATFRSNLGNALSALGRRDEAIASYRTAIALDPAFADAHSNLGNALLGEGELDEAIACYRRAIALKPGFVAAHKNLGNALREQGKLDDAAAAYRQALALDPHFADAHNNLGVALKELGRLDEAIAAYQQAVIVKPDYAEAYNNLGNALRDRGRTEEAVGASMKALAIKPRYGEAYNNLGNALTDAGKLDEAVTAYRLALAVKPDHVDTYLNLGSAQASQGKLDEAMALYSRFLEQRPDSAEAHSNIGNVLKDQGRFEEASASYERALALKPDFVEAHSNLLFSQHYMDVSSAERLAAARRYGQRFEGRAASIFANDRAPARRLRIGYVSGDFHTHPVGFLLTGVLEAHDRTGFEVFCYANRAKVDEMTLRLRRAADHWRSIIGMADADAAAMIARDRIDILIDLSGHTAMNRLPLFALRPAPLQVSWLGYFGTTGVGAIDYLLMDEAATPRGEERWYTEAIVRLPHGRFCYTPPAYAPAPAPPPCLRRGHVTFGSFNNLAKVGPEVVALWAATLKATPHSKLLLKWNALEESARRRLCEAFAAAGVEADRLEFRGHSPHPDMLAEYCDMDIALDPFPFGGGVTSCEALWMGAPVVTLPGDRPASRQTLGFLTLLGLGECVASSPEDYVLRAAALAADPARLASLRRDIRPRMAASPLCDGALFTPALEQAFRTMWRRWVSGEAPTSFDAPGA